MTTTKTKITKATVQKELRRIKAENPDNVNPTADGMCLYHQGRGRNIQRCIIGQLGWELGLPTPPAYFGPADELVAVDENGPWAGLVTEAAADYMVKVQQQADGDGFSLLPWGQVSL